jgi:hypothetical protein
MHARMLPSGSPWPVQPRPAMMYDVSLMSLMYGPAYPAPNTLRYNIAAHGASLPLCPCCLCASAVHGQHASVCNIVIIRYTEPSQYARDPRPSPLRRDYTFAMHTMAPTAPALDTRTPAARMPSLSQSTSSERTHEEALGGVLPASPVPPHSASASSPKMRRMASDEPPSTSLSPTLGSLSLSPSRASPRPTTPQVSSPLVVRNREEADDDKKAAIEAQFRAVVARRASRGRRRNASDSDDDECGDGAVVRPCPHCGKQYRQNNRCVCALR